MDFANLFGSLLTGSSQSDASPWGDMMVGRRKPNQPPTQQLLPSEQGVADMHEGMAGAHEAIHSADAMGASDEGGVTAAQGIGSALKGLGKSLSGNSAPIQPMQMYGRNPLAEQLANSGGRPLVKMYGQGGRLQPGILNLVGDKNGQFIPGVTEGIVGNQVIPSDQTQQLLQDKGSQEQRLGSPVPENPVTTPMPNGVQQTENASYQLSPDNPTGEVGSTSPGQQSLLNQQVGASTADTEEGLQAQLLDKMTIKPSPWKDLGAGLVQAADNFFNHKNEPIKSYGEIKRDREIKPILGKLGVMQSINKGKDDAAWNKARIDNIYADNAANLEKIKAGKSAKDVEMKQKARAAFRRSHPFFDPAKASQADTNALAQFGETPESMGAYDFTKPNVRTVAGVTYKLNPNTQSYEDVGLPTDKSKAITDFEVTDPNTGTKSTYSVSNEKAASLKTQLEAAGMQISAAKERQTSQQTFTAAQNATRAAALKTAQDAVLEFKKQESAAKASGDSEAAKRFNLQRESLRARLKERVKSGDLDQADFDAIPWDDEEVNATGGVIKP